MRFINKKSVLIAFSIVCLYIALFTFTFKETTFLNIKSTQRSSYIRYVYDNDSTTWFEINNDTLNATNYLPHCDLIPTGLVGPTKVLLTNYTEKEIEEILAKDDIEFGGRWSPKNCKSKHEIAILIPYRDRHEHLLHFLLNMHPIFMRQELTYNIFLIEPLENITFNRGLLLNIGYIEANKLSNWSCYALHDIDLISEDDRLLYHCPEQPMHFSYRMNKNNYKPFYEGYFGGVSVVSREHFAKANGFSNVYFGWGAEDDDFRMRIQSLKHKIVKPKDPLGRYFMHKHKHDTPNVNRGKLLRHAPKRYKIDGLNSVQYELIDIDKYPLYTKIIVSYNETKIYFDNHIKLENGNITILS